MITIYEAERLIQLIRNKNRRIEISCDKKMLSFDLNTQRIVCKDGPERSYKGRREEINILPRLIKKYTERKSFEAHQRAYIVKNIGKGTNNSLDNAILNNRTIEWIGDEVSCGVGMQRIDILLSVFNNNQRVVIPIELKAGEANERNVIQIQRYVDWIEQYYIPNRQSDIEPLLASKKIKNKRKIKIHRI
jgi:RecB family endonuclease NucS